MTPEEKRKLKVAKSETNIAVTENSQGSVKSTGTSKTKSKPRLVLKCEDISKRFFGTNALDSCNIRVNKGEVLAVIGPEGHGKSTLAKIITGLIRPSKGVVYICGEKAGRNTNDIVSYQPDIPYFKYDTTVSELLNMYSNFFDDFSYKRAYELLKKFDISRRTRFDNLSTTALFIVQVIMVSSRKANLYVFDDPLIHCDPKYRGQIIRIIDKCRKFGAVVLLSQTAVGLDDITDKVVFLKKGSFVKEFYDANSFERDFGNSTLSEAYKEVFKRD